MSENGTTEFIGTQDGSVQPSRPLSASHLAFIDSLRGLAALWVVIYHWLVFRYAPFDGFPASLINWLFLSHIPVDAFIVISGFCLTVPVANSLTMKDSPIGFYLRRARRILPPLYASLALSLLFVMLVNRFGVHGVKITVKSLLENVLLLQDYFQNGDIYNGVLWTVAAEWKIYFVFPLFVVLLRKFGPLSVIVAGLILAALHTEALLSIQPHRFLAQASPWYVLLFAFGVVAGYASKNRTSGPALLRQVPKLTGVLGAVFCFTALFWPIHLHLNNPILIGFDVLAGGFVAAALTYLAAGNVPAVRKCLENRHLIALGTFSYSIYLTHLVVLYSCRSVADKLSVLTDHPAVKFGLEGLVGIPLAICFAYGFFLLAERPFLARRKEEIQSELARDAVLSPAP